MRALCLIAIVSTLSASAGAVICKTIEPDGTVSYADVPAAECANPVQMPDYSRYAPRVPQSQPVPTSPATATLAPPFDGYREARIVQPEQNGTVRNNEGVVPVVVVSEPALQAGHEIEILLDGRRVEGRFPGSSVVLNGVDRGTHTLRAIIYDPAGAAQAETGPVRFTLRKTGLFDQPPEAEQPVAPPPTDYSPPAEGPDYSPGGASDYQPPAAPSGSTPGRTNPAFAPSYGG